MYSIYLLKQRFNIPKEEIDYFNILTNDKTNPSLRCLKETPYKCDNKNITCKLHRVKIQLFETSIRKMQKLLLSCEVAMYRRYDPVVLQEIS